jgi:hypothetical protein
MTTSTVAPEIVAFASEVRAALSDLSREEVDDLTDGLEADLAEAYAEDLRRELPDPVAYATELRGAAGMPRRETKRRGALTELGAGWERARERLAAEADRNPTVAGALAFAVSLRPAWWLVRAWVATWLLASVFGLQDGLWFSGIFWIVMPVLGVASVQWGRGRWDFPSRRELVVVGNVIAAVALLPVLAAASSSASNEGFNQGYEAAVSETSADEITGLTLSGDPVTNVYAYDAAGQPLTRVQLFDQDGRPLDPFGTRPGDGRPCADEDDAGVDCTSLFVPAQLVTGKQVYNVFPLDAIASVLDEEGQNAPAPGAAPAPLPAPFLQVPAVQPAAAPTPQPVATPNE